MSAEVVEFWRLRAACRGMDPDLFFTTGKHDVAGLQELCGGCPSRLECLDHALEADEPGWWGGMSEDDRHRLVRSRRRQARDAEIASLPVWSRQWDESAPFAPLVHAVIDAEADRRQERAAP